MQLLCERLIHILHCLITQPRAQVGVYGRDLASFDIVAYQVGFTLGFTVETSIVFPARCVTWPSLAVERHAGIGVERNANYRACATGISRQDVYPLARFMPKF